MFDFCPECGKRVPLRPGSKISTVPHVRFNGDVPCSFFTERTGSLQVATMRGLLEPRSLIQWDI